MFFYNKYKSHYALADKSGCNAEINYQRYGVNDSRNQRTGHERGVKVKELCEYRKRTADGLCEYYGAHHREADNNNNRCGCVAARDISENYHPEEISAGENNSAHNGDPDFFPEDLEIVIYPNISERKTADNKG